ncbi:MAG: bifunctional 4-hydroxy-2-oxoglutarate aldolase/2-dehydro-3-deoxy-phosphogluconate aldolase [Phreatobacter sp.]|uniref:bifunctional 4-hydroxy-2-oxoglutarate aldolase/2-dehydro-3-deoxy-phosphogluconate aldolase n=1 Tax=Phreatobacter sp. TaxID=1966341 RepID=UPI001A528621|nr:bifunctional 4-hydroxy-2-oxoglutarate aldolase/2-dehydro-3-deoxy-phosphogluconate aldolase [Phreatobacter sp.]MBL8571543.1 bifunctional 4-hydroxy-2-oxoglutarate aldolase/2-dehydro-3-deoxy-phosphogluconate aldolase [Phreatobacter sp.]
MPIDARPLLAQSPVIPVLTISQVESAVPLARALVAGGLPVLEVTLRTAEALDAIREISREVPGAIVGAGTITREEDIQPATAAGSQFLVSPGTPAKLAAALAHVPVPVLPGAATASEAMALAELGFGVLKFFPAEPSGGVAFLKALQGPLPGLVFCPTGGIDAANAAAYLALRNVGAVGGSWVAPADAIASGDFRRIEDLARAARALRP